MAVAAPLSSRTRRGVSPCCALAILAAAASRAAATDEAIAVRHGGKPDLTEAVRGIVSAAVAARAAATHKDAALPANQAVVLGVLNDRESVLGPRHLTQAVTQNKLNRAKTEGWVYAASDHLQFTSPDGSTVYQAKTNFAGRALTESVASYRAGIKRYGLFSNSKTYIPEIFYLVEVGHPDLLEVFLSGAPHHGRLDEVLSYVDGEGFDVLGFAASRGAGAEIFGVLERFGADVFSIRSREGVYLSPAALLFALDNSWARGLLNDPSSALWRGVARDSRLVGHIAHGLAGPGRADELLEFVEPFVAAEHRVRLWGAGISATPAPTASPTAVEVAAAEGGVAIGEAVVGGSVLASCIYACHGFLRFCGYVPRHRRAPRIEDPGARVRRGGMSVEEIEAAAAEAAAVELEVAEAKPAIVMRQLR